MTEQTAPLTGSSTIQTWLADPVGGQLLREFLALGGQDESSLAPIQTFPLQQLVALSQGKVPQGVVDDLVLRANGGVMPEVAAEAEADAGVWTEKITPGRFAGKTVIVTGAGSGIGRATAARVAREGGRVIAVDISAERLADFKASVPEAQVETVTGDITKSDAVDTIVAAAGDRIDALANVAGIMDNMTPLHEVSDEVWERVFAVNVDGLFRLSRAVLAKMVAAKSGSIVNVASEAGIRGSAAGLAYTASKHAVVGITRSAAFTYARLGIRVNAVAPGPVATNIEARFDSPLGQERIGTLLATIPPVAMPDQLAASITFLLSDDATNLTGVILPSDGGWSVQ
ncbi:SDR family NAD(P)-dependent oxidoreductase [Propionicimonas sp.]|uniref:SDR family NAD(P)-dependent oxidoreductase n=1 Tax=Propionicimonas sp. TaxID=1955623 RepID=UPI00179D318E|nr:SDR family NAD(P)-dependent oxidoreductase [Propionicimonas sp.]MBU3975740.1 SDR family NAD(P)-dependent oxidoreductase [Actinomycetota bacterium]MBA3019857.1 SDR family NAD(P)-dependent oxidoreductase [Propionicimonas sp.]MBU3986111.1 SDR family NAD(P)-dependent oxidoreductase [Actinomycetota bacterium]MBU4007456.1 SDR family NAD(P)-dependent oxidoreductase [Actinomycetota bacterium]MBU4063938.1 SDR family NAD(P)-dependent oxidoreductase [Actinomycetota bacterium]